MVQEYYSDLFSTKREKELQGMEEEERKEEERLAPYSDVIVKLA